MRKRLKKSDESFGQEKEINGRLERKFGEFKVICKYINEKKKINILWYLKET